MLRAQGAIESRARCPIRSPDSVRAMVSSTLPSPVSLIRASAARRCPHFDPDADGLPVSLREMAAQARLRRAVPEFHPLLGKVHARVWRPPGTVRRIVCPLRNGVGRPRKYFAMPLDKAQVEFTISIPLPSWVRSPVTAAADDALGRCSTVAWMVHPAFGIIYMPSTPDFQGASASFIPGGRAMITARDIAILLALVRYYVLNRVQIQRLCFPGDEDGRITRRRLQSLVDVKLINRTPDAGRELGGTAGARSITPRAKAANSSPSTATTSGFSRRPRRRRSRITSSTGSPSPIRTSRSTPRSRPRRK